MSEVTPMAPRRGEAQESDDDTLVAELRGELRRERLKLSQAQGELDKIREALHLASTEESEEGKEERAEHQRAYSEVEERIATITRIINRLEQILERFEQTDRERMEQADRERAEQADRERREQAEIRAQLERLREESPPPLQLTPPRGRTTTTIRQSDRPTDRPGVPRTIKENGPRPTWPKYGDNVEDISILHQWHQDFMRIAKSAGYMDDARITEQAQSALIEKAKGHYGQWAERTTEITMESLVRYLQLTFFGHEVAQHDAIATLYNTKWDGIQHPSDHKLKLEQLADLANIKDDTQMKNILEHSVPFAYKSIFRRVSASDTFDTLYAHIVTEYRQRKHADMQHKAVNSTGAEPMDVDDESDSEAADAAKEAPMNPTDSEVLRGQRKNHERTGSFTKAGKKLKSKDPIHDKTTNKQIQELQDKFKDLKKMQDQVVNAMHNPQYQKAHGINWNRGGAHRGRGFRGGRFGGYQGRTPYQGRGQYNQGRGYSGFRGGRGFGQPDGGRGRGNGVPQKPTQACQLCQAQDHQAPDCHLLQELEQGKG